MNTKLLVQQFIVSAITVILFSIVTVYAWTGPTGTAPNNNVSAPINVGTSNQVKNGALSVNALAVFGNSILSGSSLYLNFGATAGSTGYGIRDNAGVMEAKDSGGSWTPISQGISAVTTASCATAASQNTQCTATCPAGYFRTGCSYSGSYGSSAIGSISAAPSGSAACTCTNGSNSGAATCYAYCAK